MIDKEKYPKLYDAVEAELRHGRERLTQSVRAQVLCELLPDEVKALDIQYLYTIGNNILKLQIRNTEGVVKTLKTLGVQGLKPQVSSWSNKHFYTEGKGMLSNGSEFHVNIDGIDEPDGCVVKEIRRRPLTISRELVCPKTGKKI